MQVFENDVTSQIGDNILEYSKNIPNPEFMFRSLKSLQVPTIGIPTSQKYFPI
jgi:hypothetical protein